MAARRPHEKIRVLLKLLLIVMLGWTGTACAEEAQRIVSVAGSLTEIVYALLGAADRPALVVGVRWLV
ncbi:MAG: hypothetical protein R6X17_08645 [Candidatus Competibacteraceae bacterium]